jgi:hypothetical protein
LGDGVNLPIGTKITNSGDDRSTGKNGPVNDFGVAENLSFTTPNGSSIKFIAANDRKTGLPTTVMQFKEAKSADAKSVTFLGAPIFNLKTAVLTTASNYPSTYKKNYQPTLFNDLMSRVTTAVDMKRPGWEQASKADVQQFFGGLR